MRDTLRGRITDEALSYVGAQAGVSLGDIVDHLYEEFAIELLQESEMLLRDSLRGIVKRAVRPSRRDEDQLTLAGFKVPSVLSVPTGDGEVVYVNAVNATREQWTSNRLLKEANISHAAKELRDYDDLTDLLETVWARHPDWHVGQCIEHLSAQ